LVGTLTPHGTPVWQGISTAVASVKGAAAPAPASAKTVESVMSTSASLYVRHTLPLAQAKAAMEGKGSEAAVVVDDSLTPMGLVYLEDIEAELVKQQLLMQPDNNFNKSTS
jgi:CBS domain-containing protein